jgi:hypothetical protein
MRRSNVLQKAARRSIEMAFDLSVAVIARFHDMSRYHRKVDALRRCPPGSLGRGIADVLDSRGLTLVPGYESHDLKHALLDFDMTPEGEVRMQAFMVGNGNYSLPSLAIFLFGALLLPDMWPTFGADFAKGRRARPISTWTIERYARRSLVVLRERLVHDGSAALAGRHRSAVTSRGDARRNRGR